MTDLNIAKPAVAARKLGGAEKAAALLLAMGKEQAAKILKYLDEEEIRLIARSASDLGNVSGVILDELISDFYLRVATDGGLQGSALHAAELLNGILPPDQVNQIMSEVRSRMNESVWPRLSDMPPGLLAQYLAKEHPQVIAFVISKTSPGVAAAVLGNLPQPLRNELMRRMLSNKIVMEPALRLLEQVLRDELLYKMARATNQNVHARIADIINKFDRAEMEDLLDGLHSFRPKEAQIVRGLLFTFEDISKLRDAARSTLFAEVPAERVILALRGVEAGLKDLVLASVPSRTRRIIEQELTLPSDVPAKEIGKARREIADLALELAERGAIELKPDEQE